MSDHIVWRVDHHGVHDLEVDIGSDTTVGEVAACIAAELSPAGLPPGPAGDNSLALTLALRDSVVDPERPAREAAPPAGSTLTLRRWAAHHAAVAPAPRAPAHLLEGESLTPIAYGTNQVHPGVIIEAGTELRVRATGAASVSVDGAQVRDTTALHDTALLRCDSWTATVRITGPLRPPPPTGPWRLHASRRGVWPEPRRDPVDLPHAPEAVRAPGMPWLTIAVPVAMAAVIWLASGSLMWAGFMAFTVAYVVAAALESRHETRAEDRFRVQRFREDLAEARDRLEQLSDEEQHDDELRHPSVQELLGWLDPLSSRLWERPGTHPAPLVVRLGTGFAAADTPIAAGNGGRAVLREEADSVSGRFRCRSRPILVDLRLSGGLAVVGHPETARALVDAILLQLAVLVPPEELAIRDLRRDPGTADDFSSAPRWIRWLPHRDSRSPTQVLLVDAGGSGHESATPSEATTLPLWLAPCTGGLPDSVQAVVHVHDDGSGELAFGHTPVRELALEGVDAHTAEAVARRLAPLRSSPHGVAEHAAPTLSDLGILAEETLIEENWSRSGEAQRRSLVAPLGRGAGGGVLHLDLVADGPHALVAGTTGSGKSELLRTWVAGLAALHPPSRIHLLLVDYKGGASFGPLARLPHCAGLVTDLAPDTAHRAVIGLRAELKRRELMLEQAGASNLTEVPASLAPPSLVVVIDEFATMLDEVPAFVDGVLDVARRGRSLGIHVVMATQRPAGVISDAIRANTSLRLALRLPDADDSRDVLDAPDAATLPREEPGRALVRFAHDALVGVQVAYGSGPLRRGPEVSIRRLGAPPDANTTDTDASGPSELDQLVAACRVVARRTDQPLAVAPWTDPLPERVELPLPGPAGRATECVGMPAAVVLGTTDLPHEQRRGSLEIDLLRSRGLLAVGAANSGTSTTLATLAAAAACAGWQVHAISSGEGPGVLASGVRFDDHELVRRLLHELLGGQGGDRRLLVIDDLASFELAQREVNRGEAMALLTQIATSGSGSPTALAVAARRRGEVPHEISQSLGERLVHRCIDVDAALSWDAPEWMSSPEMPAGRVWHRGRLAQVGLWCATAPEVTSLRRLPTMVSTAQLAGLADRPSQHPGTDRLDRLLLPIGLDAESLRPAVIDLRRNHFLVAGGAFSGRTSCLRAVAEMASAQGLPVHAAGDQLALLRSVLDAVATPGHDLSHDPALVLLDDLDEWLDDPEFDELLDETLRAARRVPMRLLGAADAAQLVRLHSRGIERMRAGRCGILLGDDAHDHAHLLHTDLRQRQDLPPAAGRAWVVQRGVGRPVQLAAPSL